MLKIQYEQTNSQFLLCVMKDSQPQTNVMKWLVMVHNKKINRSVVYPVGILITYMAK